MLTSYDFLAITGLKLGSERIKGNDLISPTEIRSLLGVIPPWVNGKNVSLMWLNSNINKCETVAVGTQMFMVLFIGTLLCHYLGSTMSLCYLWSLRDISWIKNYDWGGMAYATLLHLKTQLSCHNHSSLGMNRLFGRWDLNSWLGVFCESYLCCCWCVLIYFRFGCMNISVLVHNFWKMLMICFQSFFVGCLSIIYQCPPSVLCKLADGDWQLRRRGGEFFFFGVLGDVQMSLDPWLRCEEHDECAWARELNVC